MERPKTAIEYPADLKHRSEGREVAIAQLTKDLENCLASIEEARSSGDSEKLNELIDEETRIRTDLAEHQSRES